MSSKVDAVKTALDVASVARREDFLRPAPKYAVVYMSKQRAGTRVSFKSLADLRNCYGLGTASFSATWDSLSECGRDVVYVNAKEEDKSFQVLALAEKLPPDWAWSLALELNEAETNLSMGGGDTFMQLCRAFGPTLILGEPFLLDPRFLAAKGHGTTAVESLAKHVTVMGEGVKEAVCELALRVSGLEAQVKEAVESRDEEKYLQIRNEVKSTKLPFPFSNLCECEDYLSAEATKAAAEAAFMCDEQVLKAKAAVTAKREVCFPARVALRFLLRDRALAGVESKHLLACLGEETKKFLCDSSRMLMGKDWQHCDAWILARIRRSYYDATKYAKENTV